MPQIVEKIVEVPVEKPPKTVVETVYRDVYVPVAKREIQYIDRPVIQVRNIKLHNN